VNAWATALNTHQTEQLFQAAKALGVVMEQTTNPTSHAAVAGTYARH
jgi:hypothetical protein